MVVLPPGARTRFHVLAWGAQGQPVVLPEGARWTALGTLVGASQGASIEFEATGAPTTEPTYAVRATVGAISCQAKVLLLPRPGSQELLLSVVDEGSGWPVAGATVVVSNADGVIEQQTVTDLKGVARVTPSGPVSTLSVFHADYSYQTIANHPGAGLTVFMGLRRNPADRHGGSVARFTDATPISGVRLARVGFSTSGDEFEFTDEREPTVPTDTRIGPTGSIDTPVPMGTYLAFGDGKLKATATAFGVSSTCADEAATISGRCGTQSAWSIMAVLSLSETPADLYPTRSLTLLPTLNAIASFKGFTSSVVRDVTFSLEPAPLTPTGAPDFLAGQASFSEVSHSFNGVRLGFDIGVKPPPVPRFRGEWFEQELSAAVTFVPGRGLVPIGLGVATNRRPADNQVDDRGFLQPGSLRLRLAPPHHGLEGLPTAVVSQYLTRDDLTNGRATSSVLTLLPGALEFDPRGERAPLDQTVQQLPALVDGRFNFSAAAQSAISARGFSAEPVASASLVRVTFIDSLHSRWDVLVDPASPRFALPLVPGALRDRLFMNGNSVMGARSQTKVKALQFKEGGFVELVGQNPAAREAMALTGWSVVTPRPLALRFAEEPPRLGKGHSMAVFVEGFRVGRGPNDDGVVRVTFEGANCGPVTLYDAFQGSASFSVPGQCQGQAVVVRAELFDRDQRPLDPPVEKRFSTSIE